MDGRTRPYFCGVDRSLNFQQKEALAQGIQQVIDTTPSDFEFFEFQFSGHQVYIYKLDHGIILLVLTVETLSQVAYDEGIERLKLELQQDVANTIATFRLLAGNTTLSGQNYWKQGTATGSVTTSRHAARSPDASDTALPSSGNGLNAPAANSSPNASVPPGSPSFSSRQPIRVEEVLAAMNHLSQFTTQYLGPTVVTNYWKATCPKEDWLQNFQVERSAQIASTISATALTPEQHQWLQEWVDAFIHRCSKVIRDFPKTVRQTALDDRQKSLLLTEK